MPKYNAYNITIIIITHCISCIEYIFIIVVYFIFVTFIGFYVKDSSKSSEEFFMAGREMTAWIAGLSFMSANLGALELMGWAGSAYQYGILATHAYWIGAVPAMLFLGIVMMPFYYISKANSVPGYLHQRFGSPTRAFSAMRSTLRELAKAATQRQRLEDRQNLQSKKESKEKAKRQRGEACYDALAKCNSSAPSAPGALAGFFLSGAASG